MATMLLIAIDWANEGVAKVGASARASAVAAAKVESFFMFPSSKLTPSRELSVMMPLILHR